MKKVTPAEMITAQQKVTNFAKKALPVASVGMMAAALFVPALADDYTNTVQKLIQNIINIICFVVAGIGVFMTIWGIVGMIMASKQEDTNAQTQASQKLMVGIALIALPIIIKALNLDEIIMSQFTQINSGGSSSSSDGT